MADQQLDAEKTTETENVEVYQGEPGADPEANISDKATEDFDEAYKLGLEAENLSYTPEEEAKLLRKIDWHVLPVLSIVFGLQYLDKTTLSYASIMGIQAQTHLVGQDYSWLGTIFYFGYMLWEYPANRLMQRLPLAKYTAFTIVVWGAILAAMAGAHDFAGLMVVRFFLGVFEASVTPGFVLFTAQWYKTHEQGTRIGIWYSFQGWAQIFGGLVAYGIAHADSQGQLSIPGWKIIFVLTALMTVCAGIVLLFVMPDSPVSAKWLNEREKQIAIERIRENQQGVGNKHFKAYQVKEALLDSQAWLFVLYGLFTAVSNGGITNYFSLLITSFGYTSQQSLLYGTPAGAVQGIALIVLLWAGDFFRHRLAFCAIGPALGVLGILLVYALPGNEKVGKLIGWYILQCYATGFVGIISLIGSNMAGFTKKTTVGAMFFIGYCVGNIIGPQVFQAKDAPKYTPALITILVCWSLCVVVLLLLWFNYYRENRKRDAFAKTSEYVHVHNHEFLDLTDKENKDFRYAV